MYVGCTQWCEPPAMCRPSSAGWYWSHCAGLRNAISGCALVLPEVQRCPWQGESMGFQNFCLLPAPAHGYQPMVLAVLLLSEWGTRGPPLPRGPGRSLPRAVLLPAGRGTGIVASGKLEGEARPFPL